MPGKAEFWKMLKAVSEVVDAAVDPEVLKDDDLAEADVRLRNGSRVEAKFSESF